MSEHQADPAIGKPVDAQPAIGSAPECLSCAALRLRADTADRVRATLEAEAYGLLQRADAAEASRDEAAQVLETAHGVNESLQARLQEAIRQRDESYTALKVVIDSEALSGVEALVAGWRGPASKPNPDHPKNLGATIKTTCGRMYKLEAALRLAGDVLRTGRTADAVAGTVAEGTPLPSRKDLELQQLRADLATAQASLRTYEEKELARSGETPVPPSDVHAAKSEKA